MERVLERCCWAGRGLKGSGGVREDSRAGRGGVVRISANLRYDDRRSPGTRDWLLAHG